MQILNFLSPCQPFISLCIKMCSVLGFIEYGNCTNGGKEGMYPILYMWINVSLYFFIHNKFPLLEHLSTLLLLDIITDNIFAAYHSHI